jgi:type VI protein secretion system component VasK
MKDIAAGVVGFVILVGGTLLAIYYDLKVMIFGILHPIRTIERLMPILGAFFAFWLIVWIYARLTARRKPVDQRTKLDKESQVILPAMRSKSTRELLEILADHDPKKWSDAAFEAAHKALKERDLPAMVEGVAEFRSLNGF